MCKQDKDLTEFHKDASRPNGHCSRCKECGNKRKHKYVPVKWTEAKKKYYQDNKDKFREYKRNWRQANKEKSNESNKKYRDSHKESEALRHKKYRETHQEELKAMEHARLVSRQAKQREWNLRKKYGVSIDEFNKMIDTQQGKCATCNCVLDLSYGQKSRFAVDHNHETGKVRGVLCNVCNISLGLIRDNVNTLQNMITYLGKGGK